jgi:hypothetical protein
MPTLDEVLDALHRDQTGLAVSVSRYDAGTRHEVP